MSIITEDGTGLTNANAYIDVVFADGYFTERNESLWLGTIAEKEAYIIRATDYIELVFAGRFLGVKFSDAQSLSHPRLNDADGTSLGIPLNLKKACAEYAKIARQSSLIVNPVQSADGLTVTAVDKEVAGIKKSIKYDTNKSLILIRSYPTADFYLRDLIRLSTGVIRA